MQYTIEPIAHIENGYQDKFGIPRQAGLIDEVVSRIVFEKPYNTPEAFRGMEGFSHLWLIWGFSKARREGFSPTVRPPRLGGNTRMGVFATRSPYRPNPIGLSCVRLERVDLHTPDGPVITVSGADLMDGTPILDIKPYIPYADCHPEATGGFTDSAGSFLLEVDFPPALLALLPEEKRASALGVLSHDPRPSYQQDPNRTYGLTFAGFDIRFRVEDKTLHVTSVHPLP